MANKADQAWDAFFDFFIKDHGQLSAAQIVDRFDTSVVTPARVRDWRRRHSRPSLAELPMLSERWTHPKVDPLFFARLVGAVPGDGLGDEIWLQRRIVELRRELRDLETKIRLADTTEATGSIVAAATASSEWAVAVQPAIEGPTGLPLHVADRLDFRRVYTRQRKARARTSEREALEQTLHDVMSRYSVVYAPTLPSQWSSTADTTDDDPMRYSVRHTTAQFSPARLWEHPGIRSVAVVSLTLGPWTLDVAALVARMLGYGFVSTAVLTQAHRSDGRIPTDAESMRYRTEVHREQLMNPWHRYVWAHVGDDIAPGKFVPEASAEGVHVVWLQETPALLKNIAGRGHEGTAQSAYWLQAQQSIAEQLNALDKGMVHRLPCESAGAGADGRRTPRWDRTFTLAADIVEMLVGSANVHNALGENIAELGTKAQPGPINACLAEWLCLNRVWGNPAANGI